MLLDPTNVDIANNQANATAAGMPLTNVTSSGPAFVPTGSVADSLVTVSSLQSYLNSGTNVQVSTNNASGTSPTGNIKVVDPISWDTYPTELALVADNNITINGAISGSGLGSSLRLSAANGSITQAAAIAVPALRADASGSVTLTNASNSVGTLAGSAGASGFSFNNAGSLTIGTVAAATGITAANGPVSLTANGGDLIIGAPIAAGTGPVTLIGQAVSVFSDISGGSTSITGNDGVNISSSALTTSGGNINLASTGGGVSIFTSTLTTNNGGITIAGGGPSYSGIGVDIENNSSLHAGTGAVSITGQSASAEGFFMTAAFPAGTIIGSTIDITGIAAGNGPAGLLIDAEAVSSSTSMHLKGQSMAICESPTAAPCPTAAPA